jgi:DcaP outer membrane protein
MELRAIACFTLFGVWVALASSPARAGDAEELRALKAEIAAERAALAKEREGLADQRRRIDDAVADLEETQAASRAAAVGAPSVGAASTELSGARLEIYGFVQLDAIYDFDRVNPAWSAALRPSRIPVNCPGDAGCGNDGETILSVRQSRLGFRGFVPTELGELRTIFEFDLFGVGADEGQTTIRLRHAWGELGQFGAGQTNSLFMDGDVFPNTIEYWGPAGMVFLRNPQVRWTPIQDENWKAAVAIEAPGSGFDQGKVGLEIPELALSSWNSYPDLTGQVRYDDDWGHVQLAAILRGLGVEGTTPPDDEFPNGREYRARELGWGVSLGSAFNMSALTSALEGDQLLVQVTYGHGISNYMNDGGNDLAPDSDPPGAQAKTVPSLGWMIYYNRSWNERWTSSIGYSEHHSYPLDGQTGDSFKVGRYGSVNVLYHPLPNMLVGPELLWGERENKDGDAGDDTRIQVSFKYNFDGTIWGGAR